MRVAGMRVAGAPLSGVRFAAVRVGVRLMGGQNSTVVRFRQAEQAPQVGAGVRARGARHRLGRAARDEPAAAFAALRPEVEHPVRGLDHVEVVLDHDDAVPGVAQPVEHVEEKLDVVEVQAGGRLVQDIERSSGIPLGELQGELHALGFAPGERGRRLSEPDVAEADVDERLQPPGDGRHGGKEGRRFRRRHLEHLVDVLPAVADLERLAVVALAVADIAGDVDVGQEMHFHLRHAVALAGLAAPALHVEGEAPCVVPAPARLRHAGEKLADRREEARVGRRIGARRAADGALVHAHHLVEELETLDGVVRRRIGGRPVEVPRRSGVERVVHERGLARAGHAGHAHEKAERHLDVDAFQVVAARAADGDALDVGTAAHARHFDAERPREIAARQRVGMRGDVGGPARRHHPAAGFPGARPHVDDVIGLADRFLVVLDHDDGVAEVAQALQRLDEPRVVALVQADRRLVEHVQDPGQAGADLAREADALGLPPGERLRGALEREVVEPDVHQELQARRHFVHHALGDLALRARQPQGTEEIERCPERPARDVVERLAGHADVARLAAKARAAAVRAGAGVDVLRQLLAHHRGVGLAVAALVVRHDALERMRLHRAAPAIRRVAERNLLRPRAVQHHLLHLVGKHLPGLLEVEAVVRRERLEHREVERIAPVPAADRAAREAEVGVRHDALRVEELHRPEPVAARTGAHGVVEREKPRLELG